MKQALILDETVVKKTIEDAMVSDKGQQFWEKLFKDPEFSSKFAKSMGKEQTALMKTLLKDPEYQAGVMEIMKNPEVEKMMLQTMKSKEYRQYLQQVLTETAESPLFQAKMIDIISKGVQKAEKSGSDKKEAGGEGGSQEGKGTAVKIITIIMSGQYMYHPLIIILFFAQQLFYQLPFQLLCDK